MLGLGRMIAFPQSSLAGRSGLDAPAFLGRERNRTGQLNFACSKTNQIQLLDCFSGVLSFRPYLLGSLREVCLLFFGCLKQIQLWFVKTAGSL